MLLAKNLDKIQNALELRKKRKEKENKSFKEKKAKSDAKISAALEAREKRVQSNLQSTFSSLQNDINTEIDKFKSTVSSKPSFGADSLKNTLESTRESRVNLEKLKRNVEAHRKYFDGDNADKLIEQLDQMAKGYNSYLEGSKVYADFESEEDYNKAVADAEENQRLLGIDTDALENEIGTYEKIWSLRQQHFRYRFLIPA